MQTFKNHTELMFKNVLNPDENTKEKNYDLIELNGVSELKILIIKYRVIYHQHLF